MFIDDALAAKQEDGKCFYCGAKSTVLSFGLRALQFCDECDLKRDEAEFKENISAQVDDLEDRFEALKLVFGKLLENNNKLLIRVEALEKHNKITL